MAKLTKTVLQPRNPGGFLFRGNAVAAGGFLTRLEGKPIAPDRSAVTTNGQSCLPLVGGLSHSVVHHPVLAFPKHIRYGACETFVWGRIEGNEAKTTLRAIVTDVRLTNSPSPDDNAPGVSSVTFEADRIAIEVESTHPQTGQPSFEIRTLETVNMALTEVQLSGDRARTPIELVYNQPLIECLTMEALEHRFVSDSDFFEGCAKRLSAKPKLVFGKSRLPRTPQGYYVDSIVKQIRFGEEIIEGNSLTKPGLGTLSFGLLLTDEFSRRISMGYIKMGSDAGGDVGLTGVETNGIWK